MSRVTPYLLNLVYVVMLVVTSPYLLWQSLRRGKYREGFCHKVLGRVPKRPAGKKCLWLHGVSVGEINLLATLVSRIEVERPDWQCVISTTTKTGMALARRRFPELTVFYCPLDFSWSVRTAMRRIAPDVLVLAELELWPNLIRAAKEVGAKVAVVNGRLSQNSFRGYRRIRPLVARVMRELDLVAAQGDAYAGRFHCLGARGEAIHVTGSMKFDGARTDRENPETSRLRKLAGITSDDVVFVAGSTQQGEETAAIDAFRHLHKRWSNLKLLLVPRHPHRFEDVARELDASGMEWRRRSDLDDDAAEPSESSARILLVDTVGELGAWWGTADIAYVGGSMGSRGGQNMIEPAAYGAAVSFGPNTRNFRDTVALMLAHEAAVVVEDGEALTRFVQRCLDNPDLRVWLGENARALVLENLGATERTIELLDPLVDEEMRKPRRRRRAA